MGKRLTATFPSEKWRQTGLRALGAPRSCEWAAPAVELPTVRKRFFKPIRRGVSCHQTR